MNNQRQGRSETTNRKFLVSRTNGAGWLATEGLFGVQPANHASTSPSSLCLDGGRWQPCWKKQLKLVLKLLVAVQPSSKLNMGQVCNCFGFKYFSTLSWACLLEPIKYSQKRQNPGIWSSWLVQSSKNYLNPKQLCIWPRSDFENVTQSSELYK